MNNIKNISRIIFHSTKNLSMTQENEDNLNIAFNYYFFYISNIVKFVIRPLECYLNKYESFKKVHAIFCFQVCYPLCDILKAKSFIRLSYT